MTKQAAIEFLDDQGVEILAAKHAGENFAFAAILVKAKTIPLLLREAEPHDTMGHIAILTSDREINIQNLCARRFEIALGTILFKSLSSVEVRLGLAYEYSPGVEHMMRLAAERIAEMTTEMMTEMNPEQPEPNTCSARLTKQ